MQPHRTTTQRGYGHTHQQTRAQWTPTVQAGHATCTEPICLMPTRHIKPTEPWDLAHNRATGRYRGPAHTRCNRSEGARWLAATRRHATGDHPPRHSRTW